MTARRVKIWVTLVSMAILWPWAFYVGAQCSIGCKAPTDDTLWAYNKSYDILIEFPEDTTPSFVLYGNVTDRDTPYCGNWSSHTVQYYNGSALPTLCSSSGSDTYLEEDADPQVTPTNSASMSMCDACT
jgi:hypothetical protein